MNFKVTVLLAAIIAALAFTAPMRIHAQSENGAHHHYKLIDLGTFGGPGNFVAIEPGEAIINNDGMVVGSADTPALTPEPNCYSPNLNLDCNISHAFLWNGN